MIEEKITLEDGDYLENRYAHTIRSYLPNYEYLWSAYIGHDGKGKMPIITGLPQDIAMQRNGVGELLYTCLESLICVYEISKGKLSVDLNDGATYITMLNSFIAFQAHCGRIRDNFDKIGVVLLNDKRGDLTGKLEAFYQQRNEVLHGKKIPMRIEDSLIVLPKITAGNNGMWSNDMNWEEENLDFHFLVDYLSQTCTQLFEESNSIIGVLIKKVKEIVAKYSIVIHKPQIFSCPPPSGSPSLEHPISGSSVTYRFKIT